MIPSSPIRTAAAVFSVLTLGAGMSAGPSAHAATTPPSVAAPEGAFPLATYNKLLGKYADKQGRVNYQALKKNAADLATLELLYASIAATGPKQTPTLYEGRDAALAYYLSAYNVLVWKNVVDRLPKLKRVSDDGYAFFQTPTFFVDGAQINLNDLEKKVILPRFQDGRMHFALNCASGGCPVLPMTAFTPAAVQKQLEAEARRFANEARNVDYDAASGVVRLSEMFKWYESDFGGSPAKVVAFVNGYRKDKIPPETRVQYIDYDWRLNDMTLPSR